MQVLPPSKYNRALESYKNTGIHYPLIRAVLNCIQRGTIYSENIINPSSFFTFNDFGFAQLFGEPNSDFENELFEYIYNNTEFPIKYLLWYNAGEDWLERTRNSNLSGSYKYRTRARFIVEEYALPSEAGSTDREISFEVINSKSHLDDASVFKLDLCKRFWNNCEDFLKKGIGVLAYIKGKPVAICYAATVARNEAEVDVMTIPEHQGKGLGKLITRRFIKECFDRSLRPTWDCFIENEASSNLALTCGFKETFRYPFLSLYREFN